MNWRIEFHDDFEKEFEELAESVQDGLLASLIPLREIGPNLGRPNVDTLNGSRFANMKELRFNADNGVWRLAFAFDPERNAILLVAGDKTGISQTRFYKRLIKKADQRYSQHIDSLKERKK